MGVLPLFDGSCRRHRKVSAEQFTAAVPPLRSPKLNCQKGFQRCLDGSAGGMCVKALRRSRLAFDSERTRMLRPSKALKRVPFRDCMTRSERFFSSRIVRDRVPVRLSFPRRSCNVRGSITRVGPVWRRSRRLCREIFERRPNRTKFEINFVSCRADWSARRRDGTRCGER
jgi:hypothetical protein